MSCRGCSKRQAPPSSLTKTMAPTSAKPRRPITRFDHGLHRPAFQQRRHLLLEPRDAFPGRADGARWHPRAPRAARDAAGPVRAGNAGAPRSTRSCPCNDSRCASRKALSCARPRRRSCTASVRARQRSRIASSLASGTCTALSSPARCSRASLRASRRSVLTRSPARLGISDGRHDRAVDLAVARSAARARSPSAPPRSRRATPRRDGPS